jgi:hypothetical protein
MPAVTELQFAAVPTGLGFDHVVGSGVAFDVGLAVGTGLAEAGALGAALPPGAVGGGEAEALTVHPPATMATAATSIRPLSMRLDICTTPQEHVPPGEIPNVNVFQDGPALAR